MNERIFEFGSDHESESHRIAPEKAILQNITSAMSLLEQAGEDIAVAHLQAAFDVLSPNLQGPHSAIFAPS